MTNRPQRESDGKYHIKGQTYKKLKGSRREVWNKTAYKTDCLLYTSPSPRDS